MFEKKRLTKTLQFVFLVTMPVFSSLQAAHIIGGVFTYKCLSNGKYEFTLKIYRDCNGGGALFDSEGNTPTIVGTVSVYRGAESIPIRNITLGTPVITQILPNLSNPCLVAPPNVCVQEGVYTFTIDLPTSTQSYHIIYQRCCRNNTITNIVAPGETGATYYMELTPRAQLVCNNSPVFNSFPPIVICTGEPIDFDHAATDADGDQLVYELCAPFKGGGTDQNNATAPNGVAPNPDLPPPYQPVTFISPLYTFSNPLASNPGLSIDSNTGFLTGIPQITGQFVVGVCVKEYRNGELLSEVRRDFQFNVARCDPTVVADIKEDEIVTRGGKQFFAIRACGANAVPFTNQSYQQAFIDNFKWQFDIGGNQQTFSEWNPTVNFPGIGIYYGQLLLNVGTNCGDTADIEVNIFPDITADFTLQYDTCIAGPVAFTDLSYSDAGPGSIISWNWDFGDGQKAQNPNPVHLYKDPGSIPISLTVRDTNQCEETKIKNIDYFPVPGLLIVKPSDYVGCNPAEIFFNNLSSPIDETYNIAWDFGDGGNSDVVSPTHTYLDIGTYTVGLSITSPSGCRKDTSWQDLITILSSPVADFSFSPPYLSNLQPTAYFVDQSLDAMKWKWTFGNSGVSIVQNPVHTFPDTGLQVIQLVVFHESGCTDTTWQTLDVLPEVRYFLPNAFTPNGDGVNDGFRGDGALEGATNFNLSIWNRYGEKLFETGDPKESWNGRKNNTGNLAPQGVYIVVVHFRGPRGEPHDLRGFATLVK